jgi:iron complex outermembrane receptor protein
MTSSLIRYKALASALLALPSVFVGVSVANAQQSGSLALEEITVTAERRESTLQDVPVAVSAFDSNEIERRQAFNVKDVVNNVPNLVGANNVGQGTATTVFLRGVGTTESIVTVDTAMGFYLDDVYIARQGVNNFSLYDVERVEVLRGPQGTLYGRNTNAGAINVITTKPQDTTQFSGQLDVGEFDRVNLKGMANVVLQEDKLFFRLNALSQTGDGYVNNAILGRDVNDTDFWGVRAGLRWLPTNDVEVLLTADHSTSDQNGVYALNVLNGIPGGSGRFDSSSVTDIFNESEAEGVALTVDWDISPDMSIQSITSFRNTFQQWDLDLSDSPIPVFRLYTINDSDQLSQEIKLTGTAADGRFQYAAGLFYFDEDSFSYIGDRFFGGNILGRFYDVEVTSTAAYFDGTYDMTDKLSLVFGGRYTQDDKSIGIQAGVGGTAFENIGTPTWNTATLNALGIPTDLDFSDFTPKIGLKYAFSENLDGYLTYTQGFRAGGWAARTNDPAQVLPFEPEVIDSIALGLKATVWDGRARINSEFFLYDYQDLFNSATDPTNGNFRVFTNNADVMGLEIEGTVRLTETLDMFGFAAFSHGEYKDVDPVIGPSLGENLQRLPDRSMKIGFTNLWPMASGAQVRLNADYQYTEEHFTDVPNTVLGSSGDIKLVSAAVSWESADDRYSIGLSCRNCSNREYNTATLAFAAFGFVSIYPGEPRTWLLSLKARTN